MRAHESKFLAWLKGSPDQPRDDHGRWATGGGTAAQFHGAIEQSIKSGEFVSKLKPPEKTWESYAHTATLPNGAQARVTFSHLTTYSSKDRIRDPAKTRQSVSMMVHTIDNGEHMHSDHMSKSARGESPESNQRMKDQRTRIEDVAKKAFGLDRIQWSHR